MKSHRKMKILIVANYKPNKSGISSVVAVHLRKLAQDGFDVDIFNTKKNAFLRIWLIFLLIHKVRNFDVIHIHGCSGLGFYPIVIGILSGKMIADKKTIVTFHGGGAEAFLKKRKRIVKWFLEKADHITVMSKYLQKVFSDFSISTIILKNVIDIKITDENHMDFSFPKMLSVRSLSNIYNIQDIIEAFKVVKTRYTKVSLKIVGSGDQLSYLKKLSTNCKEIEFLGVLANVKVHELIRSNNVFITVPDFDNQPMSILEAFANGIIVISTNVGGIPDMIDNGRNGLLIDVHCPEQIADKIDWIFSHPELAKKIIEEGRKEVKKYLWENIKPVLFELYEN